jgi:hypothetical protein
MLERLAKRNLYAITSFIFGMDNDTPGGAVRTLEQIRSWPPGLPVFGLLTPFPVTPLYKRIEVAGRLGWWAWTKVIAQNRQTIFKLVREGFGAWRLARMKKSGALVQADETSLPD